MLERPQNGERAILVHLQLDAPDDPQALEEFRELAVSAGAAVAGVLTGARREPEPRFFIGSGKADQLREQVRSTGADLVLVNHPLSPSQERNLERHLSCRVLDRAGLILDIFAQRARSFEGKLQVELAQLRHLSTRLVRGWTHLERQKGGIGQRGPGETQLETDRRLIGGRIRNLNRRLERVQKQREQGRRNRRRHDVPTVSLVGYTNAGKSTLFNTLTGSSAYSADQLFATLDPTIRRLQLDAQRTVVLADTVGFIRDLPHDLVAAFRSTLQETREASLLLHVIDAHDEQRTERITTVNQVLDEIGAADVPHIEVFNKIDLAGREPALEYGEDGMVRRVHVSAHTGAGLDLLTEAIAAYFAREKVSGWLTLDARQGRLRSLLFGLGAVTEEHNGEAGEWIVHVELPRVEFQQLCSREGIEPTALRA